MDRDAADKQYLVAFMEWLRTAGKTEAGWHVYLLWWEDDHYGEGFDVPHYLTADDFAYLADKYLSYLARMGPGAAEATRKRWRKT